MKRPFHLLFIFFIPFLFIQASLGANPPMETIMHLPPAIQYDPNIPFVSKSDSEWQKILTPMQFKVLRKKGTEPAFSGQYDKFYEIGTYLCVACGNPLYSSVTKFDSKTGWPSFWKPLNANSIITQSDDLLYFIKRTEVLCKRCGGHLGHLFKDGPKPTKLRYCMNSVALTFVPAT